MGQQCLYRVWVMVLNGTLYNISVILVEEIGVPEEIQTLITQVVVNPTIIRSQPWWSLMNWFNILCMTAMNEQDLYRISVETTRLLFNFFSNYEQFWIFFLKINTLSYKIVQWFLRRVINIVTVEKISYRKSDTIIRYVFLACSLLLKMNV